MTALSHAAEEALDQVRRGHRAPDAALVTGVLAIVDRLSMLCERLASEGAEPAGEDGDVIASLSGDAPDPVQADAAPAVPAAIRMRRDDDIITELQGWRSIRVPLPLLDSVMTGVTDIVLARNELSLIHISISPLVSLSIRWTMPGRATPPIPDNCPAQ